MSYGLSTCFTLPGLIQPILIELNTHVHSRLSFAKSHDQPRCLVALIHVEKLSGDPSYPPQHEGAAGNSLGRQSEVLYHFHEFLSRNRTNLSHDLSLVLIRLCVVKIISKTLLSFHQA